MRKLREIYGIGNYEAKQISYKLGIPLNSKELGLDKKEKLLDILKNKYGKNLKREKDTNILNKIKLNSYVGKRHKLRLPVKGQRTRSNGKTAKRLN